MKQTFNQVNDVISIHYSGFLTDKAVSPAPKLRSTCLSACPMLGLQMCMLHLELLLLVVGGWVVGWLSLLFVLFSVLRQTLTMSPPAHPHSLLCSSSGYPMPLLLSPGVTWTIGMQHCARHSCLVGWELLAKHHR